MIANKIIPKLSKAIEKYGVEIDFAYRTFRWDNEAQAKAHVHCVIVGFHVRGEELTQSSQSARRVVLRSLTLRP